MANGNMGKPSSHRKKFSTHLGGEPAPGAPPAYATAVVYVCDRFSSVHSLASHWITCPPRLTTLIFQVTLVPHKL